MALFTREGKYYQTLSGKLYYDMSSHILLDFEILVFLDVWLELVQYIFSDQSSDFFHKLYNYSKKYF